MATLLKLLDNGQCELKDGGARVDAISWDKDGNFEEIIEFLNTSLVE